MEEIFRSEFLKKKKKDLNDWRFAEFLARNIQITEGATPLIW